MHAFRRRCAARVAAGLTLFMLGAAVGCSSPRATPEPSVTTEPNPMPSTSGAAAIAASLTDEQLVGQVLMPDVSLGHSPQEAADLVRAYDLGGVILMPSAVGGHSADEVRSMTAAIRAAQPDLGDAQILIGTDQEYGFVTRITSGIVQLPSALAFGAAARPDLTEAAWAGAGEELHALGIDVDFAPDADVLSVSGNTVIGSRSFGADPEVVSGQVAAAVTGLQSAGVAATIKHFPGHGNTTVDSHTGLPVLRQSRQELEAVDLAPFRAGIAAGVRIIMAGHLDVAAVDPGVPASFSHAVLTGLLRDELGFTGVVISDSMRMEPAQAWPPAEAAVRAILAGNDLLLMPSSVGEARDGLLAALGDARLSRQRLVESVTRILDLKLELAAAPQATTALDTPPHQAAAQAVAAAAVTVLAGPCDGALVTGPIRLTGPDGRNNNAAKAALHEELTALGISVVSSGGSQVHLVGMGDGPGTLAPGAALTVAMDTPYVLASATSPVRVAVYSTSRASMHALAAVIAGNAVASGRSPVLVTGLPSSACTT